MIMMWIMLATDVHDDATPSYDHDVATPSYEHDGVTQSYDHRRHDVYYIYLICQN